MGGVFASGEEGVMHEEGGGMPTDPRDSMGDDEAYAWLKRAGDTAEVPLLYTTAVRVGEDPWRDIVLARELESFAEAQTAALRGRDAEDGAWILQVTDLVDEPDARVRTAVALAGLWAERGLRVVLVDADLRFVGLARHLDAETADAEGFVDALEYGASGPSLLRATAVSGVRVLPLGSYRPDHTHSFSDEALRRLVRQLRAEADVVILLAPAWTAEGRFHPLLVHSDAVVLSFDLDRSLAQALDEVRRYLDGLGIPLAAMATRVGGDPAASAVDVALSSQASPRESGGEATAPSSPSSPSAPASPYADLGRGDSDEGSSPLLRNSLVALVVVLLAFVGWWGWTEFSAREEPDLGIDVARLQPPLESGDNEMARSDSPVAADSSSSSPVAADSSSLVAADSVATEGAEQEPTVVRPSDTPVEASKADTPTKDATAEESKPALASELFLAPRTGWALHPWSFADSTDAVAALASLEREGMHPIVRGTVIKGSRWYRVLVGNFASRGEAWQAREGLASMVRADWIGVVRVTE